MKYKAMLVVLLFGFVPALLAQDGESALKAFGGDMKERAEARILFWDSAEKSAVGEFVITYGRPEWKPEYSETATFDKMTKGKVWRVGKNFWTMLDTNVPLRVGGEQVEPGQYYLGVLRSNDGAQWQLCFFDPVAAREDLLDASEIDQAEIAFTAPLMFSKSETVKEKLEISLEKSENRLNRSQLKIQWGSFELKTVVFARLNGE